VECVGAEKAAGCRAADAEKNQTRETERSADLWLLQKKTRKDGLRVARMKLEELVDPRIVGPRKQSLEDQVLRAKLALQQMEGQYELLGAEQKSIETKQKLIENQLKR